MLLGANDVIIRGYSVKRFTVAGNVETFVNRHDFLGTSEVSRAIQFDCLNCMTIAEQHLLHNTVNFKFRVAIPQLVANDPGEHFKAFAVFAESWGGMWDSNASPVVEYPIVLALRKYPTTGRTGKSFYFGALREMDINRDERGRVYLRGGHDEPNLQRNYFNQFMLQSPLPPVLATVAPGTIQPYAVRPIMNYGGFTAHRLTSVPDAQQRKTFKAIPYKQLADSFAENIYLAGAAFYNLANFRGDPVQTIEVVEFMSLLGAVNAGLTEIAEYYNEGVKLSMAAKWRPTAGLNPYTTQAQEIIQQMITVGIKFKDELTALIQGYPDEIPQHELQSLEKRTWQIAGMYVLFLERERFTGTPIPLNLGAEV